jgi:O-phospho-L-seryl-tRNASec:L-selenocysteinyl-tRNA synthase
MSHGVGRSGNLTEVQPKALGSSMLASLANELTLQAIQLLIPSCKGAMVVPMATGMAMALVMLAWKKERPETSKVVWSRIDQKSCLKCIQLVGLEPIVMDPIAVEVLFLSKLLLIRAIDGQFRVPTLWERT